MEISNTNEHEHTVFEKMLNTNMGFSKKSNANTCFVEIIEHGEHEQTRTPVYFHPWLVRNSYNIP